MIKFNCKMMKILCMSSCLMLFILLFNCLFRCADIYIYIFSKYLIQLRFNTVLLSVYSNFINILRLHERQFEVQLNLTGYIFVCRGKSYEATNN